MPLDVAELYAQNKRDWASGNETQKNLAALNNQQIRDAYGVTQDVPLGEVERYIDALKTDNTKKSLITKITNPSVGDNIKSSAEAIKNFSYNPANDPAYQSYVDAYNRQGQSAAKQTMANLASTNMGRNSSYGAAATAQVQQAYAKQAADMIPQLAQQAYERLINNYSIDKDLEDTEYNRAFTGYQTLADDKTRQLTDEQLRLGNVGAEIDLKYKEPNLQLAYEQGLINRDLSNLTKDQTLLELDLNRQYLPDQYKYQTEALRREALGLNKSSGSGGSNSIVKNQNMAITSAAIKNTLLSNLSADGSNIYDAYAQNENANPYYTAIRKFQDADYVASMMSDLTESGYSAKDAATMVEGWKEQILTNIYYTENGMLPDEEDIQGMKFKYKID